jgi:hypothetical protein
MHSRANTKGTFNIISATFEVFEINDTSRFLPPKYVSSREIITSAPNTIHDIPAASALSGTSFFLGAIAMSLRIKPAPGKRSHGQK